MKSLTFLLATALILIAVFVFSGDGGKDLLPPGGGEVLATVSASINPFQAPRLSAKAIYVFDLSAGEVLFSNHADAQLPLASLAKLITATIALDLADDFEERVYISPEALTPEGESGLILDDSWKVYDLAAFGLIASSNDAAEALALFAQEKSGLDFAQLVQDFTRKLNLNQTYLLNPTGLDVSMTAAGAYGSARDIAAVLEYALKNYPSVFNKTTLAETTFESLNGRQYKVRNTNPRIAEWPLILLSKTGFTDLAGGNLALIFEAGPARPIISVVLGSTLEGRFSDTALIMETVFNHLIN